MLISCFTLMFMVAPKIACVAHLLCVHATISVWASGCHAGAALTVIAVLAHALRVVFLGEVLTLGDLGDIGARPPPLYLFFAGFWL